MRTFTVFHANTLRVRTRVPNVGILAIVVLTVATYTPPAESEPPGIITTIAGGGSVGDGLPAREARLSLPGGVLAAPNQDLVIVDFGNHRIRRVERRTGRITSIAGTGCPGFSGDGGPACVAQLARPENAAFAPDGSLYIVDSHNHRIRRIGFGSNIIETVAGIGESGFAGDGGPARLCMFHQPEGIAFDAAGNYFIGDTLNYRVRRIDAKSGEITTVAGSGQVGTSLDGVSALDVRFLRVARLAVNVWRAFVRCRQPESQNSADPSKNRTCFDPCRYGRRRF
jgi:hypothetical protein